jgi:hypothetical protein
MSPKTEWPRIDAEANTIGGIYTGYVVILAAIGPIAILIGQQLVGMSNPRRGPSSPASPIRSARPRSPTYCRWVVVYVSSADHRHAGADIRRHQESGERLQGRGLFVDRRLGRRDLQHLPMLGWLGGLLGLYGLYLLYLGLPRLMRVGEDKAVGYTVVVIVVQIVLYFLVAMVVGMLVLSFFGAAGMAEWPGLRTVRY